MDLTLDVWFSTLLVCLNYIQCYPTQKDIHGGVKMGVINDVCDNGKDNLEVDWDYLSDFEYTCRSNETIIPFSHKWPRVECINWNDMPRPIHKCMNTPLEYEDIPPRGGFHRPLWPKYGEYLYVPPQRWIHSLEHGAAVFLYHPCADPKGVEVLKSLAKGCLRKHIITPYRKLPLNMPFAVVTYGCRLMLANVDEESIINYVREKAMKAPEHTPKDGQYSLGLLQKAQIVKDYRGRQAICPDRRAPVNDEEWDIYSIERTLRKRIIM